MSINTDCKFNNEMIEIQVIREAEQTLPLLCNFNWSFNFLLFACSFLEAHLNLRKDKRWLL